MKSRGSGGATAWSGKVSCDPGYSMVGGQPVVKCLRGLWSGNVPVCVTIGHCDPAQLAPIANGWVTRLAGYRGGVRRYHCHKGHHMVGSDTVWCDSDHWVYGQHNIPPSCVQNNWNDENGEEDLRNQKTEENVTIKREDSIPPIVYVDFSEKSSFNRPNREMSATLILLNIFITFHLK